MSPPIPMSAPIHILQLEDDPADALLVQRLLTRAGLTCEFEIVEAQESFVDALRRGDVDLVLSDHSLPAFDSMKALELTRRLRPELPFIIVSGTLDEEWAVRSLRNVATDYILKERPARLVSAVRRALKEVEETEKRRSLERQFIEAQKMEVVGRLVGGVAHDFNNILSVIMGYCEAARMGFSSSHPASADLEEALHAADRGAALVRQLLVFSSRQALQAVVLDLNETVEAFQKMLQRLIGENISMTVALQPGLRLIRADSGRIDQVMMNMVVNARDALPHGGEIAIETRAVELSAELRGNPEKIPAGEYSVLSVRDTGIGMSAALQEQIFNAFFTTKAKGFGTGLGLSTCRSIIRQCRGFVDVKSEVGLGTTFDVYFPAVEQTGVSRPSVPAVDGPVPSGTETILLVEDDPALRRLATRALHKLGYTVLCASNGEDGLRLVRAHNGESLALVVTDVIMPQMGGQLMAERLMQLHPTLKFLFTSGYGGETLARHGALDSHISLLPKPYTPSVLARRVRELIDAA